MTTSVESNDLQERLLPQQPSLMVEHGSPQAQSQEVAQPKTEIEKYSYAIAHFRRYDLDIPVRRVWEESYTNGKAHWQAAGSMDATLATVAEEAAVGFQEALSGEVSADSLAQGLGRALARFTVHPEFEAIASEALQEAAEKIGDNTVIKRPTRCEGKAAKAYFEACATDVLRRAILDLDRRKTIGKWVSAKAWESAFPLRSLPKIPCRGAGFYAEPWCGIFTITGISTMLVGQTCSVVELHGKAVLDQSWASFFVIAIWTWAVLAAVGTCFILCSKRGELRRSSDNCYPIPVPVGEKLIDGKSPGDLRENIVDTYGKTYCVRCLLWRPSESDEGKGHHCSTCQRCVVGFDHHCGVFGRCIRDGNMPCFYMVISMFFFGCATAVLAVFATARASLDRGYPDYPNVATDEIIGGNADKRRAPPIWL